MLSVILSTAGNDPERAANLQEVLHCLKLQTYTDWELIIVEQSLDGAFYNKAYQCDHYLAVRDPRDRGYNPSWGRNLGAKIAKGTRLVFLDADVIFGPDFLEQVAAFRGDPFFICSDFIYWSNRKQKLAYQQTRDLSTIIGVEEIVCRSLSKKERFNIAVCFERDWYWQDFGGYIENFFRWGLEDTEATDRIFRIFNKKLTELDYLPGLPIGHLFHQSRDLRSERLNLKLYRQYKAMEPTQIQEQLQAVGVGNPAEPSLMGLRR